MTTWILLRGLTRESRHWGRFVAQFQQALPDHRIDTLDLAGNGLLNQHRSPIRVQDMVAQCRSQLSQRHIAPPYHLLAMSLGAMVAAAWARAHSQDISAMVLINTSMRPLSPFYQRLLPANYGTLLRLILSGAAAHQWERAILQMTSNQSDESVLPHWLELRRSNPVSRLNGLRQLVAAARFELPPDPPATPTLLLASEHDHLVSVNCSKSLARSWQCDLCIHPSAGHDIALDDGPWVAARVCQWLLAQRERSKLL